MLPNILNWPPPQKNQLIPHIKKKKPEQKKKCKDTW